MSRVLRIRSSSNATANVDDIILRETITTRLVFRPTIVDNKKNQDASVRGIFVYQRKAPNDSWEDHNELTLSNLKASEWIKLEIRSGEMLQLFTQLQHLYDVYRQEGIPYGQHEVVLINDKYTDIVKSIFSEKQNFDYFIESGGPELISECLKWMGEAENLEDAMTGLRKLDINNLSKINSAIGVANIEKMLSIWENNRENSNEEFWQTKLFENSWVLSQLFSSPIVIHSENAYVGGKKIDNSGGNIVDFIYKNEITNNIAIIEIKTPKTKLIGPNYRNNAYCIHQDLIGGISQVLAYKNEIEKSYYQLFVQEHLKLFNPKCILIAGNLEGEAPNETQLCSFELFRHNLTNVEVITYDELFAKLQLLLDLLQAN